jgi:hypothetical protein
MANLTVSIEIDDAELDKAIGFVYSGAKDERVLAAIKQEYFKSQISIDLTKLQNQDERNYHTNGLVAILVSLQNE